LVALVMSLPVHWKLRVCVPLDRGIVTVRSWLAAL
jgi:hypothetical protein